MFCSKCGNEIDDSALVCPNCGCPTSNYEAKQEGVQIQQLGDIASEKANSAKKLGIISLILSIIPFTAFIGIILAIVGLVKANSNLLDKNDPTVKQAKKLCIIGLCLAIAVIIIVDIISFNRTFNGYY
jgi:uncharacterized membrane protein YvbJ